MDLRQFTTTPNNFDHERRTSISSMSSAQSGYASSAYGGNQTPNNSRFGQSRYFGQPPQQHPMHQQQLAQQFPQQQNPGQNSNWLQQGVLNVTPWIEQQQQVSQSTTSIENQNFVNSYGNNLNGQIPSQFLGHQQQPLQMTQSLQASFDSQSSRPSPTSSHVMTTDDKIANTTANLANSNGDFVDHDSPKNDNNDSNDNDENDDDDELIPTAIVIKNIPFAIKKEQLLEVMTKLKLPLPYAFNYHFDNGVFRGLAFANFTSTDETTTVVNQLNGREIGGRKLRVEYKKMLPLAERERIEREKREKRGQLEEQHRSTSSASLASMISISSAPAGNSKTVLTEPQQPLQQPQQPLQPQHTASERFYAPVPFVNNLPITPSQVDLNDPETLEFYSQLLFFKDDREKQYNEIAYPPSLSSTHRRIVSVLAQFLGLIETSENSLVVIKRRPVIHDPSPLLRSQSHSAIPLLNQQQAQQTQRFRTLPQQAPSRIPPNFNIGMTQSNNALSTAALLRNNPTPTRGVMSNMYNNGSQGFYQNQPQQPQSASGNLGAAQPPAPGMDPMSRFNLQSNQWDDNYGSGSGNESEMNDGLNALNLGLDSGSNIWGPRSMQPTA
jgi:RNA recognition motif-containing protein